MDMLNKAEQVELLIKEFPSTSADKIDNFLLEWDIDPYDEMISGDAIARLKVALGIVEDGVKSLPPRPNEIQVADTISMVQQKLTGHNISIPIDSLMYFLQSSIEEAQMIAAVVTQASRTAFTAELAQGQKRLARDLAEAARSSGQKMQAILSDSTIKKMVDAAVIVEDDFDIEKYLNGSKELEQRRAIAAAPTKPEILDADAYVDAFIKRVNS